MPESSRAKSPGRSVIEQIQIRARELAKQTSPHAQSEERRAQLPLFDTLYREAIPKDDIHTMEHPFFALGKRKDMKPRRFTDAHGRKTVILPSFKGLATIYDKDVLNFAMAQLAHAKNSGDPISRRVRISTSAFITATRRGDGGDNYKRISDTLVRLKGTVITTEIETNGEATTKGFGWIGEEFEIVHRGGSVREFTIELPKWVYNILLGAEILTICPEYYDLSPLERRVYEVGRKQMGRKPEWKIGIEKLKSKCIGDNGTVRGFKYDLKPIIANGLPGMSLVISDGLVIFARPHNATPSL